MFYTLSTAAIAAGVAKSTISKAIKSGELSVSKKVGNSFRIDPAELDRWMSNRGKRSETVHNGRTETPQETGIAAVEKAALQREIDLLRETLDDMKEQRDKWEHQAQAQTRLLEHRSKPQGVFNRLFGKSA